PQERAFVRGSRLAVTPLLREPATAHYSAVGTQPSDTGSTPMLGHNVRTLKPTWAKLPKLYAARILQICSTQLVAALRSFPKMSRRFFHHSLRAAYIYRVPLLLCLFAFAVMSQPGQIQELYVLTLGEGFRGWVQLTLVVL